MNLDFWPALLVGVTCLGSVTLVAVIVTSWTGLVRSRPESSTGWGIFGGCACLAIGIMAAVMLNG